MIIIQIINEIITNGYNAIYLDLTTFLSIICAIIVVVSKNPIVSVLFLIGLFINIASYLLILGISFIGISYLLVYVGAVSILFLFILMLINVRISELVTDTSSSIPLALLIIFIFNYIVNEALPFASINYSSYTMTVFILFNFYFLLSVYNISSDYLYKYAFIKIGNLAPYVSSITWDSNLSENSDITSLGNVLYTSYSIWLIITSIILLLAMVGAIVITIKQNYSSASAQPKSLAVMRSGWFSYFKVNKNIIFITLCLIPFTIIATFFRKKLVVEYFLSISEERSLKIYIISASLILSILAIRYVVQKTFCVSNNSKFSIISLILSSLTVLILAIGIPILVKQGYLSYTWIFVIIANILYAFLTLIDLCNIIFSAPQIIGGYSLEPVSTKHLSLYPNALTMNTNSYNPESSKAETGQASDSSAKKPNLSEYTPQLEKWCDPNNKSKVQVINTEDKQLLTHRTTFFRHSNASVAHMDYVVNRLKRSNLLSDTQSKPYDKARENDNPGDLDFHLWTQKNILSSHKHVVGSSEWCKDKAEIDSINYHTRYIKFNLEHAAFGGIVTDPNLQETIKNDLSLKERIDRANDSRSKAENTYKTKCLPAKERVDEKIKSYDYKKK